MAPSLRTLWVEPRRSSMRLWMFRIHQWAGVGAGLYLAMMGLTGSLSVFLPELRNTLVAPIHASPGQPRLSLQTLQSRIEQINPVLRLRAVYPGQTALQADTFEESTADKTIREIVVDPYTARVLIDRSKDATFYDWARDLHANLLSGKTGKTINGFGGVLLMVTGAAGILLWWPGRRYVKPSVFQVSIRKGWHRLSYDLHRLVGVLVILPLSLAVLTGICQAFPQTAANAANAVFGPRSEPLRAKQDKTGTASAVDNLSTVSLNSASLDEVVQVAREQVQGGTPVRIQAPAGKNSGFLVWMHLPSDWRNEGDNRVLVDAHSGRLLGVQLGRALTRSSRVIEGATAIHYGQYGGIPTRAVAVMVGLTLPLFYASGMVLWWRRVARLRSKSTAHGVAVVKTKRDEVYAAET
jgi:uncharacterized iron-regulated membrane protein